MTHESRHLLVAALGAAVVAIHGTGCGGGPPSPVAPALGSCTAGWQEIYRWEACCAPSQLVPHGDRLYFSFVDAAADVPFIMSIPAAGGTATTVTEAVAPSLWVEGDNLLFAASDQLASVPLAGGMPTVLQDGQFCSTHPAALCRALFLDQDFLYFSSHFTLDGVTADGMVLARMSRSSGAEDELATLPLRTVIELGRLVGSSLLVAVDDLALYVVPAAGGSVRQLATPMSSAIGLDDQGALAATFTAAGTSTLNRAPIDGGPLRSFWTSKPPGLEVLGITPDPSGGWVAVGDERFDDGAFHLSVWQLDAGENGLRLGCDPRRAAGQAAGEDQSNYVVGGTDAIYALVGHQSATENSGGIMRVARPAP